MFAELTDLLTPLGYAVYDTDVDEQPVFPYIVVWGGIARPHMEQPVSGQIIGIDDRVGVTCAAETPAAARIAHRRTRNVLQPDGYPLRVAGYRLKLTDHQPVEVDRKESIIGTNRHPAFAVDIFRVTR